jgi:hypothetical protein
MGFILIYALDSSRFVRDADSDKPAVRIGHGDNRNGQSFRVDMDALTVKRLSFGHLT